MSFFNPYRWCIALNCKNSTSKTPEKLFIKVPNDVSMRYVWLELAGRDPTKYSVKSHLYLCEDHFNLEQDMENYIQYKIMGSVKKIRMKPNTIPSMFDQLSIVNPIRGAKSTTSSLQPSSSTSCLERESISYMEQTVEVLPSTSFQTEFVNPIQPTESTLIAVGSTLILPTVILPSLLPSHVMEKDLSTAANKADKEIQVQIKPVIGYKAVQANLSAHHRSRATQINYKVRHSTTSPMKSSSSVATSPLHKIGAMDIPSTSGMSRPVKRKLSTLFEDQSDSELSFTPSVSGSTSQDFSPIKVTTSDSSLPEEAPIEKKINLENTILKIKKKPRLYIGVPKELYFIINIIHKQTKIPEANILLCLTKIRLNSSFSQISDDFGLSLAQTSKVFSANIVPISRVLSLFIKQLSTESIKLNLPIAFRHRYHKVSCIIDCLEIEIQKPSSAVQQALTWSEYKKANTIKYLVACTPDGLITFISAGYGGRVTDITLLEDSKFLDTLPSNACVLADRGFKHIETHLSKKNITLMRPPSVATGSKLSKAEVRQTKEIASLRIHVERVIRRIREFAILKPHSVVNINLVQLLDECIITACALINIQDTLIK